MKQSLSKSILIRSAIPGDEIDVARVHVRAWQVGYQGLLFDAYLTGLRAEDRAKQYTFGDPPLRLRWFNWDIGTQCCGCSPVMYAR